MARSHGNRQKHESANPIQRRLIDGFHQQVIRMVREMAPASVLEVGCGEGFVLSALVDAGISAELTGIDLSEAAVADAQERLGDAAAVRVEDARELANLTSTYDLVMMLEVLEHLENPETMLPVLDKLADRAVLMSVPREPWFRGLNFARLKNVRDWGNDPEHINHWSKRSFRRFVGDQLVIREVSSPFPWTLVLAAPRP
jgi:SAM-dependent methyltransferase